MSDSGNKHGHEYAPRQIKVEKRDSGKLIVNADFAEILEANALATADALWSLQGEDVKKQLSTRGTERVFLKKPDGGSVEAYIKRYTPLPAREYLKNIISMRPFFPDGAKHEWDAILAFHKAGIETMLPMAVASPGGKRGALLTLGITGYERASKLLAEWDSAAKAAERGKLVEKIAALAGKMHAAEFAHQDFYLVHLFVLEGPKVLPIDLQRIVFPERFSTRWRVKDLGQLLYSARKITSKEERRAFWKKYLETAGIPESKADSLLNAVKRKADSIQNRAERKAEEREKKK